MKNISIIIITHNSQGQIEKCLESVKNSARENLRFVLVLIDNASIDASIDASISAAEKLGFENVEFIKNRENIGFARAVNQGLKYALDKFDSDYFLLLNPDAFLEKNCLEKIVEKAEKDNKIGLVSPFIINPETCRSWFSGAKVDWTKMQTRHSDFATRYSLLATHYLSGCCLLITQTVIQKIGLFDERFFLYYEDADYSLRAQKAGFGIFIDSTAICYHSESQSSTSEIKTYHLVKSGLLFFHKHYPKPALLWFWLIFYLRFIYHKLFSEKKEVLRAMKDFLMK